jgi:hypothetical protein
MKTNPAFILAVTFLLFGCAPRVSISNQFGNSVLITCPDSTRNLRVVGIGVARRDGNSRKEIEDKTRENCSIIMREAIGKLLNQKPQTQNKLSKCIEQIHNGNPRFNYLSDGTIEARDTIPDSELKSIINCVKE